MEEIHQELPPEEDSKLKKMIILIGGIILIVLVISYIFTSYPISKILQGQIESNPLKKNILQLDGFSIVFDNNVREELQEIYFNEQQVEFSVCLLGEKKKSDYYISSLYQPKMFDQDFNHVSFEPCSSEALIFLHSHPYKSCIASETDMNTLSQNKLTNENVLMVVMCEPGRFSVYG